MAARSTSVWATTLRVLGPLADVGFLCIGWLPWSFFVATGEHTIDSQIISAIRKHGTPDKALTSLRSTFRKIKIARINLLTLTVVGLICALLAIVALIGLIILHPLHLVDPSFIHEYPGYLFLISFTACLFIACLIPPLVTLERRYRLLTDFAEGLSWFNDSRPVRANTPYAVYLRSFHGELKLSDQWAPMADLPGWGDTFLFPRELLTPQLFIKQSINALHRDFVIVEALNLDESEKTAKFDCGPKFKKVCLYQFYDWPQK